MSGRSGAADAGEDGTQQPSRPSLLSGLNRPTLAAVASRSGGSNNNTSGVGGAGGGGSNSNELSADFEETLVIPPRPRRLWKVSDTNIPMIPPFYPVPLDPCLTAYVADASPSVVSVRIAEALRRQSIAVEYDDENVTATCMTVDRCRFVIYLWQARAPSQNSTAVMRQVVEAGTALALPQQLLPGLLVEFRRDAGDVITFHNTVSILKKAAKSHGTGQDLRNPIQTSPMEYPRFVAAGTTDKINTQNMHTPDPSQPNPLAMEGLEHALGLLRKDRLDAQLRGMEELVALTDVITSGLEVALTVCLAVMGGPVDGSDAFVSLNQDWIYGLLVDRKLPDEDVEAPLDENEAQQRDSAMAYLCGFGGDHDANNLNDRQIERMRWERVRMGDEYHGGVMRSMALRTLANALALLSRHNPKVLYTTLSTHGGAMMSEELFQALWEDAAGASRPPGIVGGTRLASPHEATLAIRCIRLLGQAHPKAKQRLIKHKRSALEQLEKCYFIGQANHELLEYEAKRTYRFLTANT